MDRTALSHPDVFSQRVRCGFNQGAAAYDHHARLQRAVAWRLAHQVRTLALPRGPMADLGAGTGLVGRCLAQQGWTHRLQQVDASTALLACNPFSGSHGSLLWDLNQGLPDELAGAALLISSFALQWLDDPLLQLEQWCRGLIGGGWLVMAVPTARSFPEWRTAASQAGVPFSGLPLPSVQALDSVARRELRLKRSDRLRFSLSCPDGRTFLGQLKAIGAGTSPTSPLAPGQLRRLLQHWPTTRVVTWEVLLLIGQRAP